MSLIVHGSRSWSADSSATTTPALMEAPVSQDYNSVYHPLGRRLETSMLVASVLLATTLLPVQSQSRAEARGSLVSAGLPSAASIPLHAVADWAPRASLSAPRSKRPAATLTAAVPSHTASVHGVCCLSSAATPPIPEAIHSSQRAPPDRRRK